MSWWNIAGLTPPCVWMVVSHFGWTRLLNSQNVNIDRIFFYISLKLFLCGRDSRLGKTSWHCAKERFCFAYLDIFDNPQWLAQSLIIFPNWQLALGHIVCLYIYIYIYIVNVNMDIAKLHLSGFWLSGKFRRLFWGKIKMVYGEGCFLASFVWHIFKPVMPT